MENKRMAIAIIVSVALVFVWSYVGSYLRSRNPQWYAKPDRPAATQTAVEGPETRPAAATEPASAPAMSAGEFRAVGGEAAPATIGSAGFDPKGQQPYSMAVQIDPTGASIASVTLNRFRREVGVDEPYVYQRPYGGVDPAWGESMSTRGISINGRFVDLSKVAWRQTGAEAGMAAYAVDILDSDSKPVVTINKRYQLRPTAQGLPQSYEIVVTHGYQNRTGQPVTVKAVLNGPTVPALENARDIPEIVAGFNDAQRLSLEHTPATSFKPGKGAQSLLNKDKLPLLWVGVTSAYFNAIVRPEIVDGKAPSLADVKAVGVAEPHGDGYQPTSLGLEIAELTLAPDQEAATSLQVYFGPRQRAILNSDYYSSFPLHYDRTLVLTGGMCGFCTFQWLINLLVWMLSGFHVIFRDWGLAIICLVLVVRLILHPITKKSQIEMSKMGKLAPEMQRLKEKYKDNQQELSRAMAQLYREQGMMMVPVLGCLPMFLQMPIWIALWSALQSTFELRHASFLWGLTWINDLAQPDRLFYFPRFAIPLIFFKIDAINVLPILLGVVFYLQQKFTPQPPVTDPQQEQQQKMMKWMMVLLFPLMLYTGPSGLNLYILTSTAIGIWESKRVRDHLKAKEEREKAGPVIVDSQPQKAAVRRRERAEESSRSGGIMGWLADLQRKAEELRREKDKRGRKS